MAMPSSRSNILDREVGSKLAIFLLWLMVATATSLVAAKIIMAAGFPSGTPATDGTPGMRWAYQQAGSYAPGETSKTGRSTLWADLYFYSACFY